MDKVRTVLTSAVTYLVALGAGLAVVISELETAGAPTEVLRYLAVAVSVIGTAVAIIRRVTPVLPEARSIVDTSGQPVTAREAQLAAELDKLRREFP
jgi:hypothetical protein